jgi:hypothetical protein
MMKSGFYSGVSENIAKEKRRQALKQYLGSLCVCVNANAAQLLGMLN